MVNVYVSGVSIDIGRQLENEAREIYFDLSGLEETYGQGTATLVHLRPSDAAPYICTTRVHGQYLVWTVTNTDTAYSGRGKCELRWVVGETLAKSIIYTTTIAPSLTGAEEVPDPYETWYDALLEHISEYEIASDQIAANTSQIAANTSDIAVLDGRMDEFTTLTDGSTTGDAELADIRVGYDGTVYENAGDAVRGQVSDLKSALSHDGDRLSDVDGIVAPKMELGTIGMSSSSIVFNASTTAIRTPQDGGIPVNPGDVVKLLDYTAAKYRYAVRKTADSKYVYTNQFLTADYTVRNEGTLFLVVAKTDDSVVTDVSAIASLVEVRRREGELFGINTDIDALNNYNAILETGRFEISGFGVGTFGSGVYNPTFRPWRVSTVGALTYGYDLYITAESGYRLDLYTFENGAWAETSWVTSITIPKGTTFGLLLAKVTEDTSTTADVAEFLENYTVETNLTKRTPSAVMVDGNAISEFMSHFYGSTDAEAYAFFTDPHLMGSAGTFSESGFNQYMNIFAETVKQTSAAYVVCGGDWLNREDTKAQAATKLGFVDGRMRAMFPEKYYPIVGNHDFNYLGYENGSRLAEADWVSNAAMRNFWFHDHENCYYKFKAMTAQNYVLNTRTDYDGTNAYDKTMLDWFAAQLIEDDAPHGTVMFHLYYLSTVGTTVPTRVLAIGEIIEAYNAHSVCTLTSASHGYDKTYDFTSSTGHVDYAICGHTHADFSGTLGGVPLIGCDNFTEGGTPTFDLIFADYTGGKVYATRVGAGESRTFSI